MTSVESLTIFVNRLSEHKDHVRLAHYKFREKNVPFKFTAIVSCLLANSCYLFSLIRTFPAQVCCQLNASTFITSPSRIFPWKGGLISFPIISIWKYSSMLPSHNNEMRYKWNYVIWLLSKHKNWHNILNWCWSLYL